MKTDRFAKEPTTISQASSVDEQRYQRLLASTNDYVYKVITDGNGSLRTVHGLGCESVTGYTPADYAADPYLWHRMVWVDDRPAVMTQISHILKGENPRPLEHRIIHKDGGIRWVRNTPLLQQDDRGCTVAYQGVVSDVTKRKQAEELLTVQLLVTQVLAESRTLGEAITKTVEAICQAGRCASWDWAAFWRPDPPANVLLCSGTWDFPASQTKPFELICQALPLKPDASLPGLVWASGEPAWITDVGQDPGWLRVSDACRFGFHGACAFPIRHGDVIVGIIELLSREVQQPNPDLLRIFTAVGTQLDQFISRKQSEDALVAERNLMRTLMANLPDYVYVKDAQSRFILSNQAHMDVLGVAQAQDIIGKTDFDVFPAEFAAQYRADEEALLKSGQPLVNREEPVIDAQGNRLWVLTTKVPLKDGLGRITGLVGVTRNITERKQAEMAVRESQERLALVIKGSSDGIWDWNLLTNEVYYSARWKSMLGYEDNELESNFSVWERLLHPEDRDHALTAIHAYLAGQLPTYELEHRLRHKDGGYRWILARGVVSRNAAGQPVRMAGSHVDLTERRQAEERVRQSEKKYRELVENLNEGVWCIDQNDCTTFVNPRMAQMLGFDAAEMMGRPLCSFMDEKQVELCQANLERRRQGIREQHDFEFRRKDGELICAQLAAAPLTDGAGHYVGAIAGVMDITERKAAEEKLRRAHAELAQSDASLKQALKQLGDSLEELKAAQFQLIQAAKLESIGTLAAGVAHEVKNPLQTILMGLDYLSHNVAVENENLALALSDMREAVTRANAIVGELLLLSAATKFNQKAEDLNNLIERSFWLLQAELNNLQTTVVRQLASGLPPVQVDRSKMEQVFINLFLNALQAMSHQGTLSVATRRVRVDKPLQTRERIYGQFKPGDRVVVAEIQDTGPGISDADLPRIFDPFFTTKAVGIGTGLGLSVVKRIMDLHGGAIEIKNHAPCGAKVTLVLKT